MQPDPSRSAVGPSSSDSLFDAVQRLEKRSYSTYRSRIKTTERLTRRGNAWNTSLVAISTATTVASIGLLVNPTLYGSHGDALLVVLAVLTLVASLIVSNVNYGSRARAMEANYKRIQQLSIQAEQFLIDRASATSTHFLELEREYGVAVEFSENHSTCDFERTQPKPRRRTLWRDDLVTFGPYVSLLIPISLVIRLAMWFFQ